jgi:hypothetical protein
MTQEAIELLRNRFPAMFEQWPRLVYPRIHAELRVILDLNPPSSPMVQAQKPIGCSKRSCLCCTLWVAAFNHIFLTRWMTSRSHGKPCANWALPGAAYAVGDNGKSYIDEDVFNTVADRLEDTLAWLVWGRRPSDEHRPSDEGSSEDEKIKSEYLQDRSSP